MASPRPNQTVDTPTTEASARTRLGARQARALAQRSRASGAHALIDASGPPPAGAREATRRGRTAADPSPVGDTPGERAGLEHRQFAPPTAPTNGRAPARRSDDTRLDVLIIDEDGTQRAHLVAWLGEQGIHCRAVPTLAAARQALSESEPDLVLLDLELPDGGARQVLALLRELPGTDVVVTSARSASAPGFEALDPGSHEVLSKPIALQRLSAILSRLSPSVARRRELQQLHHDLDVHGHFGHIVGTSPAMRALYAAMELVAPTDETVFVTGATGTGKELVAHMLHRLSQRARGPFIALNCGAVSAGLIESELFGHERGSFTGADRQRKGVFEQAEGGTLFLDEVTEMTLDMQVRLLRVLETGVITRVGGTGEIRCDVRIIASTNRDLRLAVDSGALRQDLLYRLDVFPLVLPPLDERGEDVQLLAESFLATLNQERRQGKRLTPAALRALGAWNWPGNVRELRHVIRRAWILAGPVIDVADLVIRDPLGQGCPASEPISVRPGTRIDAMVQQLIEATLAHTKGNKRTAANLLGISLKTLYTRISLYAAARG